MPTNRLPPSGSAGGRGLAGLGRGGGVGRLTSEQTMPDERHVLPPAPARDRSVSQTGLGAIFDDAARLLNEQIPDACAALCASAGRLSTGSEDSLSSIESSFADRPGIANPPDTLSFSVPHGAERHVLLFDEMVDLAEDGDFNLHVNVDRNIFEALSARLSAEFDYDLDEGLSSDGAHVFRNKGNESVITLVSQTVQPPSWPEDVMFMGVNSAHTYKNEFKFMSRPSSSRPLASSKASPPTRLWSSTLSTSSTAAVPRRVSISGPRCLRTPMSRQSMCWSPLLPRPRTARASKSRSRTMATALGRSMSCCSSPWRPTAPSRRHGPAGPPPRPPGRPSADRRLPNR